MSDPDAMALSGETEINAFIKRLWFHLDHGWVDLGAEQLGDEPERKARKGAEDAASSLLREMASQYNTAVVAAGYYPMIFAEHMARAMDFSEPRPQIDVQGELLGIFARAYVFGLDGVEGCAQELAGLRELPHTSGPALASLIHQLKPVREVRDSLQHIEERVQGKARGHRIPASMLFLSNYCADAFVMTTADGTVATLGISEPALTSVRSHVIALDRSLTWRRAGPTCPACGGSLAIEPIWSDDSCASAPLGVDWQCSRCGFRQKIDTQRRQ